MLMMSGVVLTSIKAWRVPERDEQAANKVPVGQQVVSGICGCVHSCRCNARCTTSTLLDLWPILAACAYTEVMLLSSCCGCLLLFDMLA
jgi:hypothetical protein